MTLDRPRHRGRLALGAGLAVAALGCGAAFYYAQSTDASTPEADVGGPAATAPPERPEMDEELVHELATALDVPPYALQNAVNSVRAGHLHYGGGWSEAVSGRHQELADALGLDLTRLEDAFGTVDTEAQLTEADSEARARLVAGLDAAVKQGELSELDRDSVLKVHDLGLLGAAD